MALITALGLAKAILSYRGATTAPTTLDWVLGVVVTITFVPAFFSSSQNLPIYVSIACTLSDFMKKCIHLLHLGFSISPCLGTIYGLALYSYHSVRFAPVELLIRC